MKKNNTKPSNAQSENEIIAINPDEHDLKECIDAASRFVNRFNIVKLLGECGAYKEKGVPVRIILLYIFMVGIVTDIQ